MTHLGWKLLAIGVAATVGVACGSDGAADGGDEDGSGAGGPGPTCYSVEINQSGDGTASCGPTVCGAGDYCLSNVGICDPGCVGALDCAPGDYCNLSNGQPNANGVPIGICATPGPALEVSCGNAGEPCLPRCEAKGAQCGAPQDLLDTACPALCDAASAEQIECLKTSSCQDLGEAFEQGGSFCGIEGGGVGAS